MIDACIITSLPGLNYSDIVRSPEGLSPLAPQLNYITNIVLELKVELTKIKMEVKEFKKQISIIHLSLVNEVTHSSKTTSIISTPFQHKYFFQNPKNKISVSLHEIRIQKKLGEKSYEKSAKKAEKEEENGV